MEDKSIVFALVERRRRIAGEIENLNNDLRRNVHDLAVLDAAIRVIDPTAAPDLTTPVRPRRGGSPPGEIIMMVMDILRNGPMFCEAIVAEVMVRRAEDLSDPVALRKSTKSISDALRHHRRRGLLTSRRVGHQVKWRLAE